MASSMIKPTESDSASSDTMFRVRPMQFIAANVPKTMMGRPAMVTSVLRTLRKKSQTTTEAISAPISSSRMASLKLSSTNFGLILDDHQIQIGAHIGPRRPAPAHPLGHLDGVRARLLADGDDDRFLAIEPAELVLFLEAIMHDGEIAHAHGPRRGGDLQIGDVFDGVGSCRACAAGDWNPLARRCRRGCVKLSATTVLMICCGATRRALSASASSKHLDFALAPAGDGGVGHAFDALDARQHLIGDDLADISRPPARLLAPPQRYP